MRKPSIAFSLALAALAPAGGLALAQDGDSVSLVQTDPETRQGQAGGRSVDCKSEQSLRDTKDFFIEQLGWEPPEIDWHLYCLCGEISDKAGYNSPGPMTPETVPSRPGHKAVDKGKSKPDPKGVTKGTGADKKASPECERYQKDYAAWFGGYLALSGDQAQKLGLCQDQWFHYRDKAREMTKPDAKTKRDGKIGRGAPVGKPVGKPKFKYRGFGDERGER
jgi:hypothetical protein